MFNNAEVDNIFAGVDIRFNNNVVDNSQNPEFVSVRATEQFPLVDASYHNEFYTPTLVGQEQLENYSLTLPNMSLENGFNQYQGAGANTSELQLITADSAGPTYVLVNSNK